MAVAAHHILMAKSPLGLSPAEAVPVFPTETEATSEPATATATGTEMATETGTFAVTETGTATEFVTEPGTEVLTEGNTEFGTDETPSAYPVIRSVSSNKANGVGGGGLYTVDKPAGTEEGDLLIGVLTIHKYVDPSSGGLGGGSYTFTNLGSYSRASGTNAITTIVYKRVAGASEPDTYSFSLGSYVYGVVTLIRISDWDPDADIVIDHSSGGSSTSHAAPSITTDEDGNLILAVASIKAGSSSFTPPAGMSEISDVSNTSASGATHSIASLDQASAGATGTKTFTSAAAADWVGFTLGIHHKAASAPVITSPDAVTVDEGDTSVMTVTATDADTGDTIEFSLVGGADRHRFIINGTTGELAFKYYMPPGDYEVRVRASDGVYSSSVLITVTVEAVTATEFSTATATEFVTATATEFITETATPGDTTPPTITSSNTDTVAENSTLSHALTADEVVTWSIVGGADSSKFEISGSTLRWASNGTKDYESPDDADTDNAYVVTVRATDGAGNTTDQTITVSVSNTGDVVGSVPVIQTTSSNSGNSGTTSGSLTVTKPTGVQDGDYLFAFYTGTRYMTSVTPPSGWSTAIVHLANDADGQQASVGIYYKKITNAAGEPADYTWTFSGSIQSWPQQITIARISGVNDSTPLDVTPVLDISGSGNPVVAGAITTVTNNCLILRAWDYSWGTSTIGSPSGGETTISSGTFSGNPGGHTYRYGYKSATTAGTVASSSCSASNASYKANLTVAVRPTIT